MMAIGKIKVLMMPAEREPYVDEIENSLKSFQNAVRGYIEVVKPTLAHPDVVMVVNEEGKINNLKINANATDMMDGTDIIVGDAFLCTTCGEEFGDVPAELGMALELYGKALWKGWNKWSHILNG